MRIGIVCEGATDFEVLDVLATGLVAGAVCTPVHPNFDALRAGDFEQGTGWTAVRKFLQTKGEALALGVYDIIIIQLDASIRKNDELKKQNLPAPAEGEPDLQPLCDHVKGWVKGGVPDSVVIALPREDIESWLLAARTKLKNVEGIIDPAEELAARQLVARTIKGKPAKDKTVYRALASPLPTLTRDRNKMRAVPELERFVGKLREHVRRLQKGKTVAAPSGR